MQIGKLSKISRYNTHKDLSSKKKSQKGQSIAIVGILHIIDAPSENHFEETSAE